MAFKIRRTKRDASVHENVNRVCNVCNAPICLLAEDESEKEWIAFDGNLGAVMFGGIMKRHECLREVKISIEEANQLQLQ